MGSRDLEEQKKTSIGLEWPNTEIQKYEHQDHVTKNTYALPSTISQVEVDFLLVARGLTPTLPDVPTDFISQI